jgi:hypothetical protein
MYDLSQKIGSDIDPYPQQNLDYLNYQNLKNSQRNKRANRKNYKSEISLQKASDYE